MELDLSSLRAEYFKEEGSAGPIFQNSQAIEIISKQWIPSELENTRESPNALVFYIHGYDNSCHCSYINNFGLAVNAKGMAMFAIDFPGHGLSSGTRNLVDYEMYVDTYNQFIEIILEKFPKSTFYLAGESMGGSIAALLGLKYQEKVPAKGVNFGGAVLFAPAIHSNVTPPAIVTWIMRNFLLPIFPLKRVVGLPRLTPEMISRNPIRQQELASDVLRSGLPFRLSSGDSMLRMTEKLKSEIPRIRFPFIVIHGTSDAVIPLSGSQYLVDNSETSVEKKAIHVIPDGFHDVLSEIEDTEIFNHVLGFFLDGTIVQ